MAIYDSKALEQILPHRFPFLMVDAIIEMEPRKRIVGIKQVSIGEPYFQGHFPGMPVMPGVLQIEALAQVGAVLALRELEEADSKIPLFSGIDGARFRRPVVPGDTLRLEVPAIRPGRRIQKMRGVATVNGEVTTETEILCIIADRKELDS